MQPTDQDPRAAPPQPKPAQSEDDSLSQSLVDFIDSVDRMAFRRALEQRYNYYPISRAD